MSILQDLDPKNARFSGSTASQNSEKMSWTAPLVLFGIAAVGLFLALHYGNQLASMLSATPEKPADTSHPMLSQSEKLQLPSQEQLPPKEIQAALITFSPSREDIPNEKNSLPASEAAVRHVSNDVKIPSSRPAASRAKVNRPELANNKKKSDQGKAEPTQSTRKAAERDVDIITAIVR